jgi:hypothetical protein
MKNTNIYFDETDGIIDICYDNAFKAVLTRDTPASQGAIDCHKV